MPAGRRHGRPGLVRQAGFSLIELLIGISILGILLGMALPSFSEWIRNNQVRMAAESLREGLQAARSEAVKRNTRVRLQLVTTLDAACALSSAGPYWIVNASATVSPAGSCNAAISPTVSPMVVQSSPVTAAVARVTVAATGGPVVAFDAAGRRAPTTNPAATATTAFYVDIGSRGGLCLPSGDVRCLRVQVTSAGEVRMCDPSQTSATDPARCY